jgi:ribonuclease HII
MAPPTLERELLCEAPVAGIDEAGRGPLAGPVVAAAVVLDVRFVPDGLDDSKKVPAPLRAELHDVILATASVGIGVASVEEIDRLNILWATMLAMERALSALPVVPRHALVDGDRLPHGLGCPATAVIGGDALCASIAAASIVAKVHRDRMMAELALAHPHYGWERNVGYSTPDHFAALRRHGATVHHRRSFRPVAEVLGLVEAEESKEEGEKEKRGKRKEEREKREKECQVRKF